MTAAWSFSTCGVGASGEGCGRGHAPGASSCRRTGGPKALAPWGEGRRVSGLGQVRVWALLPLFGFAGRIAPPSGVGHSEGFVEEEGPGLQSGLGLGLGFAEEEGLGLQLRLGLDEREKVRIRVRVR